MADNVIPFPAPKTREQSDMAAGHKTKSKKVDPRIGLAYGYCQSAAYPEHLPWTDVVLGQGGGDWTR